jgi:hypothetical protein
VETSVRYEILTSFIVDEIDDRPVVLGEEHQATESHEHAALLPDD